jgi:hypothetical protein
MVLEVVGGLPLALGFMGVAAPILSARASRPENEDFFGLRRYRHQPQNCYSALEVLLMKKVIFIFMLTLGFAWNCHAQTWTYVQDSLITGCVANSTSCDFGAARNISPTVAGTVWVVAIHASNNVTIQSVSGGGGTWTLCPASSCHIFSSTPLRNMDMAFNLTGNAGTTSITVSLSGSSGSIFGANFFELLPPAGSTASFDAAGTNVSSTCTTACPGVALPITATDAIIQSVHAASPSGWNAWSAPYTTLWNGEGLYLNATSGAAPTVATTGTGAVANAIAFKSTAGSFSPKSQSMSVVNFVHQATVNCSPSCSLTIPATGSGHLLYLQSGTLYGNHISAVSGGGTWVAPSGAGSCQIAIPSSSSTLGCAYALSSTPGASSINVTMSGSTPNASFAFWEVASSSGPFSFDTQASAVNTPSFSPAGVPLKLTGTNDAIFQAIFIPGGTSGVSFYPIAYTAGSDGFFDTNAAQATLLNASSGVVPIWVNEQNNVTVVSGVAFKTGTAVALAPPTGLIAVVK